MGQALGDALDAKVMEAQAELTTVRQRLEQQIVANATMLGGLIDDSATKLGWGSCLPMNMNSPS